MRTPDWFDDLAERCGDAARYAADEGEPSMARGLRRAQRDAADLANRTRKFLANPEALAAHGEDEAYRPTGRNEVD